MNHQQPVDLVACPHCDARRPNDAGRCWLCGLYPAGKAEAEPVTPVEVARSTFGLKNTPTVLAGLLLSSVGVVLAIGLIVTAAVAAIAAFFSMVFNVGPR